MAAHALHSTPNIASFASLIRPIKVDEFITRYWERQPLHVQRTDNRYYASLISSADIERIISSTDVRYPAIRLSRNGSYLPATAYTNDVQYGDDSFKGVPDLNRITAEYRAGATVILPALHRTWVPLRSLCVNLEKEFNHVVHTNVYLTPGNTSGFSPHYDAHEVFILQVDGKKHWRVYEPPFALPHHTQPFSPQGYTLTSPVLEVDLEAGDLLYLPRGYVHDTTTSESFSTHITLGMTVYTWVELALELLTACKDSPQFRRALAPGFATDDRAKAALTERLPEMIKELVNTTRFDSLVESFTNRIALAAMSDSPQFRANVTLIGLDTPLRAPDSSSYRLSSENGNIELRFAGKRLVLPGYVQFALEAIASQLSFTARSLRADLDDASKLILVRHLQEQEFLTTDVDS